jgi:hypothetical protein
MLAEAGAVVSDQGNAGGRRRGLATVGVFVIGVALSALTNIATSMIDSDGYLNRHPWLPVIGILALTVLGVALTWRYEARHGIDSGSGTRISVKRAYGPVIGRISGGDVRFSEPADPSE